MIILRETQQLLNREGNDFSWSSWSDAREADAEIERQLQRIEQADYSDLFNLRVLFAPTGPIQEVSISSGWGREFLAVAERFDNEIKELDQFKWALQALAQPAEVQLSHFPNFVCKADELALDFGNCFKWYLGSQTGANLDEKREALESIDQYLDAMSGPSHAEFWTESALRLDPRWDAIRFLAKHALKSFGWPPEEPPRGRAVFVPGES